MKISRQKAIGAVCTLIAAMGAIFSGIDQASAGSVFWRFIIPFGCAVMLIAVGVSLFSKCCGKQKESK